MPILSTFCSSYAPLPQADAMQSRTHSRSTKTIAPQRTVTWGPSEDREPGHSPRTKLEHRQSRDDVHLQPHPDPPGAGAPLSVPTPAPAWLSLRANATPTASKRSVMRHSACSCTLL